MIRRPVLAGGLLTAALLMAGCGGKEETGNEATTPVTGTVTYKGAPVADASVALTPDSPPGPTPIGRGAFGRTNAEGKFTLMTFVADDGAVPGAYKVSVTKIEGQTSGGAETGADDYVDPGQGPPPKPKHLLPEKYSKTNTSGLTATVVEGTPLELKFDLVD